MSAVATKKPFADAGLQLTFPANFQKAYSLPETYFPSALGFVPDIMVGDDFQAEYHAIKRADANRSVMNGLQARKTAEEKLLTGPHNYHVPKPVLGQRVYANPMNGADILHSTRRDNGAEAPFRTVEVGMRGGVLETLEGQQFYKKQLERRIAQLNRINALSQGFAVQIGQQYRTDDNMKEGGVDKVEFFAFFEGLISAIIGGTAGAFTFENVVDMLKLLFRFGPTATEEDFDEILKGIDTILPQVRTGLLEQPEVRLNAGFMEFLLSLSLILDKMRSYVTEMARNVYRNKRDRQTLSKSLIKSLGFEKVFFAKPMTLLTSERLGNTRLNQDVEDIDADEDGDDGFGNGRFSGPARTREDTEQRGIPRQPLAGRNDDPNRVRYGRTTGMVVFGGPRFFGEEERQDLRPQYVAPLGLAGADPNAMIAPRPSPDLLVEAVRAEMQNVLRPLGYEEGSGVDAEEFITRNYPRVGDFVTELARAMEEKSFSKAQIAEGMRETGLDVFADYIAENTGETGPAAAVPARSNMTLPLGGFPAPIYQDDDEDGIDDTVLPAEGANRLERGESQLSVSAPADIERLLRRRGLPVTRDEMYRDFTSKDDYIQLGRRLPRELGGPYIPRSTTRLPNIKRAIIKKYQSFNPDF